MHACAVRRHGGHLGVTKNGKDFKRKNIINHKPNNKKTPKMHVADIVFSRGTYFQSARLAVPYPTRT